MRTGEVMVAVNCVLSGNVPGLVGVNTAVLLGTE